VLAREAPGAPELLMVRRHEKSSFGGAFAFPGGVLEDADGLVAAQCDGVTPEQADALLGTENGLAYLSAAIRELFEECGVLLGNTGASDVDLDTVRKELNRGELDWGEFITATGVRLHCLVLNYFSYWITPEALPKRYSTRFFLAAMPDDQDALHCGGELTDSCWMSARDALRAEREGSMLMHFPTIMTLNDLAPHESLDAMLQWAACRAAEGVPCIFPEIGRRDGESRVIVEGSDAGALK
jgi:8-oxo-dGTP pyrophosphatase MutT (NUDIX family)